MESLSVEIMRLHSCLVRIFDQAHYLETVFPDGHKVGAAPEDTDEYRATAERIGYGADTWKLCRDHEMAHTVLMQTLGLAYSPTLWAVAHGEAKEISGSPGEMGAEEELVLAFQHWRNIRRARSVAA